MGMSCFQIPFSALALTKAFMTFISLRSWFYKSRGGAVNIVGAMGCRELGADAGFVFGDHGKRKSHRKNSFFHQGGGHLRGCQGVAEQYGNDRMIGAQ